MQVFLNKAEYPSEPPIKTETGNHQQNRNLGHQNAVYGNLHNKSSSKTQCPAMVFGAY